MPSKILFYVSGHGFGHARRMTQVIRALWRFDREIEIHVRSAAPARAFEPVEARLVQRSDIDSGMVEASALAIDRIATLERLREFMAGADQIVPAEVEAVRRLQPALIVADIPFLAGDVAAAINIPCVGISNFTWDWIYGELFTDHQADDYARFTERIVKSYAKFTSLLQLPFGKTCDAIRQTIPTPLIAPQASLTRGQVMDQLGISMTDSRKRVLLATRGGIATAALAAAAIESPEFLFLCVQDLPGGLPANVRNVRLSPGLDFSDLLNASDIVISKLGYGIVSECIASRVRLVWPRRTGFAEDTITEIELAKYVPTIEISHADYANGSWRASLEHVLDQQVPANSISTDGATVCAARILNLLDES